jgi:hypothetical protein
MRDDHALLHVSDGTVTATIDGTPRVLGRGDEAYVSSTDVVQVWQRSDARLTFRGGGYSVLCGGTRLTVGPLSSPGTPAAPAGSLAMDYGKLLTYTRGTSSAFLPLALRIQSDGRQIQNSGAAAYSVGWDGVDDAIGEVTRDNRLLIPTGDRLGCGSPTGTGGAGTSASPSPTPSPSAFPSVSASPSASASPTPSASPSPTPRRSPTPTPRRSPTTSPTPPPDTTAPTIGSGFLDSPTIIYAVDANGAACNQGLGPTSTVFHVAVADPDNAPTTLTVKATILFGGTAITQPMPMSFDGKYFTIEVGSFAYTVTNSYPNSIETEVTASDPAGNSAQSVHFYRLGTFYDCIRG